MKSSAGHKDIVLALDVGTSGARAHAYGLDGSLVYGASDAYPTSYDRPNWAEQNPTDWWRAAAGVLQTVMSQLDRDTRVRVIGLTGQCPSIAPFDRAGQPLRRGIIYQDNRAVAEAAECRAALGDPERIHTITGQEPDAFYIAPKMLWVKRHEPEIYAATHLWLQPRDFVAWKLTGEPATEWSHAGATMLFDIRAREWSPDIIDALSLSRDTLPPVLPPWGVVGQVRATLAERLGLPSGVPVVIGGADSMCCAVGAGVVSSFQLSDMAGTSTCLNAPIAAPVGDIRINNYCHVVPDLWCTELGLNASGAALEWFIRVTAGVSTNAAYARCEEAARQSPPGAHGAFFVPYVADGERFDPLLRGAFSGLSLRHEYSDLARSTLEGVAYAYRECLTIMVEGGVPITEMHSSGGGARLALWNQIKADILGLPVVSVTSDATSLGVALVAGVAVHLYSSIAEAIETCVTIERIFEPDLTLTALYDEGFRRFQTLAHANASEG